MDHASATRLFYDLLWPHRAAVLRMATFLTHHPADADDLAQDAMLKAFRALGQFRPGTDARAWLMSIVRHAWIDRTRAAAVRPHGVPLETAAAESASSAAGLDREVTDAGRILDEVGDAELIAALKRLPDDVRWTLLLVDVQGLELDQAAGVMEVAVGTVKSRASRGRAMLRELLVPRVTDAGRSEADREVKP